MSETAAKVKYVFLMGKIFTFFQSDKTLTRLADATCSGERVRSHSQSLKQLDLASSFAFLGTKLLKGLAGCFQHSILIGF